MRLAFSLVAIFCLVFAVPTTAAAQAAAESVLTHALSSSAGTSMGKAMGNVTGQLAGKLGQQTSNTVSPRKISSPKLGSSSVVKAPVTPTAETPASGSLILSIQGSALPAPSCASVQPADGNSPKTDVVVLEPSTAAGPNCTSHSKDADSHPAVVNLPAAK